MKDSIKIFLVIAALLAAIIFSFKSKAFLLEKQQIPNDSLTFESIDSLLIKHRIKFSRIIVAQIKLESNYLKSTKALEDNNLIGMRIAAQRYCFAINNYDYGAFAKYATVEDCVRDIKSWQIQNSLFITKEEQYFTLLEKVYCQDKNYVKQLKQIMK